MGGKPESFNTQNQITQQQLDLMTRQNQLAEEDRTKRDLYMKPAIDFNTALAGGDRNAVMQVLAPFLGTVDKGYQSAKDSIFDKIAPGAARDFALSSLERDRVAPKAEFVNQQIIGAKDKLANIGSGLGSFSLQELGAALRGGEGASSSNQSLMQAENQRRQGTLNFFSNLAGVATSFLPTSFMKPKPTGGSGGFYGSGLGTY